MAHAVGTREFEEKHEIFRNLWIRLVARSFDNLIYFAITGGLFKLLTAIKILPNGFETKRPIELAVSVVALLVLFVLASVVLEGVLISNFGATLGKKLLNFKVVKSNNENLDFASATPRSFLVFLRGCYLYIPVVSIIGFAAAADRMEKYKISYWDSQVDSKVVHESPKPYGIAIVFGVFLALIVLAMVGQPKPTE